MNAAEEKIPVINIEHVTVGDDGNIVRGDKYFTVANDDYNEAARAIHGEMDAFDDYPDLMILITLGHMTQAEIDNAPEFDGW